MSFEIIAVLCLCAVVIILFATEVIRADLVALIIVVAVVLLGIVSPKDAVSGFSNPATLTVLFMFIISEAIFRTGVLNKIGNKILNMADNSQNKACLYLMVFAGITSMFINNTAAVALLIPITVDMANRAGWSPSKLLIPLSFASMFGGVCTLIGTSTNLLAHNILIDKGFSGFNMFGFFHYGIIFFLVGLLYLILVGDRFIPARRKSEDLETAFDITNYIFDLKILEGSLLIGKDIEDDNLHDELNLEVLKKTEFKTNSNTIEAGEILRVKSDIESISKIEREQKLEVVGQNIKNEKANPEVDYKCVEVVITPDSSLVGQKFSRNQLYKDYDVKVLAIRHRRSVTHQKLNQIQLQAGDALLLYMPKNKIQSLRNSKLFIVLKEPEETEFRKHKSIPSLLILASVVLLAATGVLPIMISSLLGVCSLVLIGTINLSEAYQGVNWQVVFLLAGLLALGKALDQSGAAEYISNGIVTHVQPYGDTAVVGSYFAITLLLTSFMSNNASVAIMTPLAIYSAESLGMEVATLVLAVMFASSTSFLTPIGYQTNMMIYSVGRYKFGDFMKVGGPLCFLFFLLASFMLTRF